MEPEEEFDEALLIEAVHRHLAYVESRLLEISLQIQREQNATEGAETKKSHVKKKKKLVLPPVPSPTPPPKAKLPRASELTKIPLQPKPVLSEKEMEASRKKKMAARQKKIKHLAILKALEEMKREYRQQYTALMTRHVAEQKHQMKERDRRWEEKLAQRKEKEQRLRQAKKPRSFRSSAVADYSFLNNLHQSNFYKIVCAELEMKKKGMLTTIQDIRYFWDQMLLEEDDGDRVQDEPIPAITTGSLYRPSQPFSQTTSRCQHSVRETPLLEAACEEEEEEEEDEESSSHSWAITALPQETTQRKTVVGEVPADSSPQISRVFEPVTMPTFQSLSQIMGPSAEEKKREAIPGQSRHLVKVEGIQRKTRERVKMFQVSRSNQLIMTRLMEELDLESMLALPESVAQSTSSVNPPHSTAAASSSSQPAPTQHKTTLPGLPTLPPIPDHTSPHNTHKPLAVDEDDKFTETSHSSTVSESPPLVDEVPTTATADGGDHKTANHRGPHLHRRNFYRRHCNNTTSSCGEGSSDSKSVCNKARRSKVSPTLPVPAAEGPSTVTSPTSSPTQVLVPLTIEALQSPGSVRVGKKTTLWSNYVLTGK